MVGFEAVVAGRRSGRACVVASGGFESIAMLRDAWARKIGRKNCGKFCIAYALQYGRVAWLLAGVTRQRPDHAMPCNRAGHLV